MNRRWSVGPKHRDGHPRIVDQHGDEVFRVNGLNQDRMQAQALALAAPAMHEALLRFPFKIAQAESFEEYVRRVNAWWEKVGRPAQTAAEELKP